MRARFGHWLLARRPGIGLAVLFVLATIVRVFELAELALFGPQHPSLFQRTLTDTSRLAGLICVLALMRALRWADARWPSTQEKWIRMLVVGDRTRFRVAIGWVPIAVAAAGALLVLNWYSAPLVHRILSPTASPFNFNTIPANSSQATRHVFLLDAIVISPLLEEIFFRGVLQSLLGRWVWRILVLLAISVIFALTHGGVAGYSAADQLFIGLLGLGCGLLFELTGSLTPGIVFHATYNTSAALGAIAIVVTNDDYRTAALLMAAVGLLGVAASAALLGPSRAFRLPPPSQPPDSAPMLP